MKKLLIRVAIGIICSICFLLVLNINNHTILTRFNIYESLSECSSVQILIKNEVVEDYTKDDFKSFLTNTVYSGIDGEKLDTLNNTQCVIRFYLEDKLIKESKVSFVESFDADSFITKLEDGRAFITHVEYQSLFCKRIMVIKLSDELLFELVDILSKSDLDSGAI